MVTFRKGLIAALVSAWMGGTPGAAGAWGEGNALYDAAYRGDTAALRALLESDKRSGVAIPSEQLLWAALEGKKYSVLSVLTEYGFPSLDQSMEETFSSWMMTPAAARVLATAVTNFVATQGASALKGAVLSGRPEIVEVLLDVGVKPDAKLLRLSMIPCNIPLMRMLIAHGADPYEATDAHSCITAALLMKSADMVEVLDTKSRYTKDGQELRRRFGSVRDSNYVGAWRFFPGDGGFGYSFQFLPDGTARYSFGMALAMAVWRIDRDKAIVTPLDERGIPQEDRTLTVVLNEWGLCVERRGRNDLLMQDFANRFEPWEEGRTGREPGSAEVERAVLSSDGMLHVQIRGRHRSLSVDHLIKAGRESDCGHLPVNSNVVRWESFEEGPLPPGLTHGTEIVCFRSRMSPKYAKSPDALCARSRPGRG